MRVLVKSKNKLVCLSYFCVIFILGLSTNLAYADELPVLKGEQTTGGANPLIQLPLEDIEPAPKPELEPLPQLPAVKEAEVIGRDQRVVVHALRIPGIAEHPEQGITKEKIRQLASSLLDKEHQIAQKATGDTKLSLDQVWNIANGLTHYYRQAGFILTRAYIPAQAIGDQNIVTIQIQEGILGKVTVEKSRLYPEKVLTAPFADLLGKPVSASAIEKKLLRINQYPGFVAHAVFRAGANPGETDILITPKSEQRVVATFAADNTGAPVTGRNHAVVSLGFNNPFNVADHLNLTVVNNFDPQRGTFGSVSYDIPVNRIGDRVDVGYSRNRFSLSNAPISSVATIGHLGYKHQMINSRQTLFDVGLRFERIETLTQMDFFNTKLNLSKDQLSVLSLRSNLNKQIPSWRSYMHLEVDYYHGIPDLLGALPNSDSETSPPPSRRGGAYHSHNAQGEFDKIFANYSLTKGIFANQTLLFRLSGQYTEDMLVPIQQFSLAGVNAVRAYPTSAFLMDKAVFGSLEWLVPAPGFADKAAYLGHTWGQLLSLSAFVDGAYGELNNPTTDDVADDEHRVSLKGYGLGLKFHPDKHSIVRLQAAKPFNSREPSDDRSVRYWVNLSYHP